MVESSVTFDVDSIAFSRRGSWLNLSRVIAPHAVSDHVHLISHRGGMHAVLRLVPEGDDAPAVNATASMLSWVSSLGTIEAAFDGEKVRLRGRGLALRIEDGQPAEPFRGSHIYRDPIDGSPVFSSNETGHRYRVALITGELEMASDRDGRAAVRVAGEEWEVELEEFRAVPRRAGQLASFEQAAEQTAIDFRMYADLLAGETSRDRSTVDLAAYVLWSATVDPAGFVTREAVLMSMNWMDRVWSWDHCFNAIALAPGLPQVAIDQFLMVFDHQDTSGALPDLVGHSVVAYGYVKPPIHGWAMAKLRPLLPELPAHQQTEMLDALSRLTEFWLSSRRIPGHRLPHYLHGNDSGWDNSTIFDGTSLVEAPDLAALLSVQLDAMADIADDLGDQRAAGWRLRATELLDALQDELWNGETFVARACDDGTASTSTSLIRLLPLVAAERLRPGIVAALVAQVRTHLTRWGLATENPESAEYEPDGYWRGPIWGPPTLMLVDGLRKAGEPELAEIVREKFLTLCETHGFAENFDALTGEGLRDRAYTWTAACYLILARGNAES